MSSQDYSKENLDKLHQELVSLSEKYRQYNKAGSQKIFIAKRMDEEKAREKDLKQKLKKEKRDFDRMERFSLKYLFHTILQNADKQKEKEKQEWLAAQLQWEQCCDEIEALEQEYKTASDLYDNLADTPGQYEDLLQRKKKRSPQQDRQPF